MLAILLFVTFLGMSAGKQGLLKTYIYILCIQTGLQPGSKEEKGDITEMYLPSIPYSLVATNTETLEFLRILFPNLSTFRKLNL